MFWELSKLEYHKCIESYSVHFFFAQAIPILAAGHLVKSSESDRNCSCRSPGWLALTLDPSFSNFQAQVCHFKFDIFLYLKLAVFAEGTRFTEAKLQASNEHARANGLPELKHHLLPRSRGFALTVQYFKGKGNHLTCHWFHAWNFLT